MLQIPCAPGRGDVARHATALLHHRHPTTPARIRCAPCDRLPRDRGRGLLPSPQGLCCLQLSTPGVSAWYGTEYSTQFFRQELQEHPSGRQCFITIQCRLSCWVSSFLLQTCSVASNAMSRCVNNLSRKGTPCSSYEVISNAVHRPQLCLQCAQVHERTLQGDFLMALLKDLVAQRRAAGHPLKVPTFNYFNYVYIYIH